MQHFCNHGYTFGRRFSQKAAYEWKSIRIRGTRTVTVPGNAEPNIQETKQFLVQQVGNQIYKVLKRNGSGTQVLDSESVGLELEIDRSVRLIG